MIASTVNERISEVTVVNTKEALNAIWVKYITNRIIFYLNKVTASPKTVRGSGGVTSQLAYPQYSVLIIFHAKYDSGQQSLVHHTVQIQW